MPAAETRPAATTGDVSARRDRGVPLSLAVRGEETLGDR